MIASGKGYSVKITCADGREFLSSGVNPVGPNIFWTWSDANDYRKLLKKHISGKTRVVKVSYAVKVIK